MSDTVVLAACNGTFAGVSGSFIGVNSPPAAIDRFVTAVTVFLLAVDKVGLLYLEPTTGCRVEKVL